MRRRFQFSLRALLILTAIAAVVAAMNRPSITTVTFDRLRQPKNPRTWRRTSPVVPRTISRLDGRRVRIKGYFFPQLPGEKDDVPAFLLVGGFRMDFGQYEPDEFVVVELMDGCRVSNRELSSRPRSRITIEGTFSIDRQPAQSEHPFVLYLRNATLITP